MSVCHKLSDGQLSRHPSDKSYIAMKKPVKKFESEVHLGLLAIMFVLLLLNVASNYVVHKARLSERERVFGNLNAAALAATRTLQHSRSPVLLETQAAELRRQYDLRRILHLHSASATPTAAQLSACLGASTDGNSGDFADVADRLAASGYRQLTRGANDEYFLMYPVPGKSRTGLLILSRDESLLGYLDDAGRLILIASVVSVLVIFGIYLVLTRFILSPFRKIRREALQAGRPVAHYQDDVEAVVDEYRNVIAELQEKESELLRLNREVSRRADTLHIFNQYLLKSMNSGIVTVDPDGNILSVNQAAGTILAVDPEACVGEHYWYLLKGSAELIDALSRALDCGNLLAYREIDFESECGTMLKLGVSVSPVSDHAQEAIGVSVLITDLTEMARLRSELEAKNRLAALGEMAGGLAHQLRNSLGAITGYATLAGKRLLAGNPDSDSIAALAQETKEAELLIKRFLHFARPLELRRESLNPGDFISDVLESFRVRPDCSHLRLVSRIADVEVIEVDPLLFKQALANLVENAVNASRHEGDCVEVSVQAEGGSVLIAVRDSGCGIPAENLERVFTPFFSSRPSGSGLGLPLAVKIIGLHGGSVNVRSEPDRGTTFTITLPQFRKEHDGESEWPLTRFTREHYSHK